MQTQPSASRPATTAARRAGPAAALACAAFLALAAPACRAAGAAPIVTLLDGDAVVIEGAHRYGGVAGLPLGAAAIVETGAQTNLLRIEWPDRTVLDLGPATKAMVAPPGFAPRGARPPLVYLLQGWAKVTSAPKQAAPGVVMPGLELRPFAGALVVQAERQARHVFAESSTPEVVERGAGGTRLEMATGSYYASSGGVLARPPAAWLAGVPRAFRDPLPLRAERFKDRTVTASALPEPTYVMLADWLGAEPALRREFPRRFAALARDPASRQALYAHIAAHPEWRPVLDPPKPKSETSKSETER